MAEWGHRVRFEVIADAEMPIVTDKILWYAIGMGGRIDRLPPEYLDAISRSVLTAHPRSFNRRALLYCLVSGRFKRSVHPWLAGLTEDQVLALCSQWERAYRSRRRRDDELEHERFRGLQTAGRVV